MSATITSVWSSYGHHFMGDGGDDTESCLKCGAMYYLLPREDDPTTGDYMASNGEPMRCTGDTGMAHGYPGERYCHEHQHPRDRDDHECEHTRHNCNCLLCDS